MCWDESGTTPRHGYAAGRHQVRTPRGVQLCAATPNRVLCLNCRDAAFLDHVCRGHDLKVYAGSWNVGDTAPPKDSTVLAEWLRPGEFDVYAITFQECDKKDEWFDCVEQLLDPTCDPDAKTQKNIFKRVARKMKSACASRGCDGGQLPSCVDARSSESQEEAQDASAQTQHHEALGDVRCDVCRPGCRPCVS